jgi:hypothetical protein
MIIGVCLKKTISLSVLELNKKLNYFHVFVSAFRATYIRSFQIENIIFKTLNSFTLFDLLSKYISAYTAIITCIRIILVKLLHFIKCRNTVLQFNYSILDSEVWIIFRTQYVLVHILLDFKIYSISLYGKRKWIRGKIQCNRILK